MKHCLIFSREIFYVRIVLCLNILWLKAVNEITARQTRTSLRKHDATKVCSIEYLTSHKWNQCCQLSSPGLFTKEYFTLGLLSSLWNIYHSTTAYFFDPPCSRTDLCSARKVRSACFMLALLSIQFSGSNAAISNNCSHWRGFFVLKRRCWSFVCITYDLWQTVYSRL